jgi:hypothetical protein
MLLYLQRNALGANDADQLLKLAKQDGLYYVKLDKSGSSFASIRASCFLAGSSPATEQVNTIQLIPDKLVCKHCV